MDGTEHVGSILGRILERLEALDTRWDGAGPLDLEAAALEHVEQRTGRMRRRTDVLTLDTCRALIRALELEKKRSRELHLLASAALADAELAAAEPMVGVDPCAVARWTAAQLQRWNAYRMDLRRIMRGAEPLSAPRLDPIDPDDGDPAELEARENPGGLEAESAELEAQR